MSCSVANLRQRKMIKKWMQQFQKNYSLPRVGYFDNREYVPLLVKNDRKNENMGVVFVNIFEGEVCILMRPSLIGKGKGWYVLRQAIDWLEGNISERRKREWGGSIFADCNYYSHDLFIDEGFEEKGMLPEVYYYFDRGVK